MTAREFYNKLEEKKLFARIDNVFEFAEAYYNAQIQENETDKSISLKAFSAKADMLNALTNIMVNKDVISLTYQAKEKVFNKLMEVLEDL